ncbi:threonine ammonia-lyase [Tenggerimyces flavus]|uniref:Threonine/serine dehydratase n=1 Tax=Tenggerimyces flavus TaxID=1708749 RepID=A0ABV7Y8D2_9ACTN|nr:threonine/serine dehydratase [Tenggerimyces flavus]MBM7791241.1 threonine dehydratase [Tenggerimyces flavus]
MTLISLADVQAAAERIRGGIVRTPLVPTLWADRLWLKPENLQVIGAFKIRGALNAVGKLAPEVRARGIISHSSGNHAQATALAARHYGVKAVAVMPEGSPRVKVERTRALGAEVVIVPPQDREPRTLALAEEHGYVIVPPFDHPDVIAGQGTIGLEILVDLPSAGTVLVPTGGGGLVSGIATAVKALSPETRVIAVEPKFAAELQESLEVGERVTWPVDRTYRTIADSVRVGVSELTLAHIRERVDGVLTVTEDQIRHAVRTLATESRLVAEPGGAIAVAAYLAHSGSLPPGDVVAVVSGGNIDPPRLAEILGETLDGP